MLFLNGEVTVIGYGEGNAIIVEWNGSTEDAVDGTATLRLPKHFEKEAIPAKSDIFLSNTKVTSCSVKDGSVILEGYAPEILKGPPDYLVRKDLDPKTTLNLMTVGKITLFDGVKTSKAGNKYLKMGMSAHLCGRNFCFLECLMFSGLDSFIGGRGDRVLVSGVVRNPSLFSDRNGYQTLKFDCMGPRIRLINEIEKKKELEEPAPLDGGLGF